MPNYQDEYTGIQRPIEIQSRRTQTIQTHNAVSVSASGTSNSSWIYLEQYGAFDKIAISLINGVSGSMSVSVNWSFDGSTSHGYDQVFSNITGTRTSGEVTIKAPYCQITVSNNDSGSSHTMSAWAYLKA